MSSSELDTAPSLELRRSPRKRQARIIPDSSTVTPRKKNASTIDSPTKQLAKLDLGPPATKADNGTNAISDISTEGLGNSTPQTPSRRGTRRPTKTEDLLGLPGTSRSSPRRRQRDVSDEESEVDQELEGSPSKKQRRGIAGPDKYAHLEKLTDRLRVELDVIFCGIKYAYSANTLIPKSSPLISPGVKSATIGFHFGNPSNRFWKTLHFSGFTPTLLPPSDGPTLPERYNLGLVGRVRLASKEFVLTTSISQTDLVERPTAEASHSF
ncbi:uracil DNA N-glycosylase Thp1 [Paramarasmius palmivorus]|uniref:Uracil DNA N-glycosylase Thp1 n=1 Tax=Paramarasmius palmivorus TaxID=297713 RepID=A0AAW0CBC6_9AGAR